MVKNLKNIDEIHFFLPLLSSYETEKYNENKRKDLESQIHELSTNIGVFEKQKQKDQELISTLKDRINVLDLENLNLLSKAKHTKDLTVDELPKLLHETVSRDRNVTNVFSTLLQTARKAVNDEISLASITNIFPEIKTVYEKQMQALKEENSNLSLELKTSKIARGHSVGDSTHEDEMSHSMTSEGSTKISANEEQLKLINLNLLTKIEDLQQTIRNNQMNFKNNLSNLKFEMEDKIRQNDQAWRIKLNDLDNELVNQRDRSLKTLNDKERELTQLRQQLFSSPPTTPDPGSRPGTSMSSSFQAVGMSGSNLTSLNQSVTEELSDRLDNSAYAINYTEKLARKDIELDNYKKQNKEFLKRIRNLQDKILEKDEKYEIDIQSYKDRIAMAINPSSSLGNRTSSSNSFSPDNRNEDYIKNVLFNYLIMPQNSKGRSHMMSALAAALHFTNEELNKVKASQKLK